MQGRIIKGIAGFYYVHIAESGIYECKARGVFRKEGRKPLVGDRVEIDILSEDPPEGNIREILPRTNALVRPAVANIDLSLACMAFSKPMPSLELLDLFLILMEEAEVPAGICFNKDDLASPGDKEQILARYRESGYPIFFISARTGDGIGKLREYLQGKTTALSGPSGVGKSSLTNLLLNENRMETGDLSSKLRRGRNTTRHVELLQIAQGTYLMDTPGFTSLRTEDVRPDDLWKDYPEFAAYEPKCRFQGCMHDREPDCAVKEAVQAGKIPKERYDSYINLYHMLKERRLR